MGCFFLASFGSPGYFIFPVPYIYVRYLGRHLMRGYQLVIHVCLCVSFFWEGEMIYVP